MGTKQRKRGSKKDFRQESLVRSEDDKSNSIPRGNKMFLFHKRVPCLHIHYNIKNSLRISEESNLGCNK